MARIAKQAMILGYTLTPNPIKKPRPLNLGFFIIYCLFNPKIHGSTHSFPKKFSAIIITKHNLISQAKNKFK
jgi:hypothetical protein